MSRVNQPERLLQMIVEAGDAGIKCGTALEAAMIAAKLLPERLTVYVWMIRKNLNVDIETLHANGGKKATGYRIKPVSPDAEIAHELEPQEPPAPAIV